MTATALTISIVIRTYTEERWDYLTKALKSVQHQSLLPLEIVIVVDHNPELLERVRTNFPDVVVVENQRARGSSGAWNSGIMSAKGEVIAFLDDDAVAASDWLEQLVSSYDREDVIGVGGAIEPIWLHRQPRWFPEEFGWVIGCTYRGLPETIAPVRNLIGCNMSFRRQVLERIGGLYEDRGLGHKGERPIGCDETELCIRLQQRWPQAVLLYNPQATVYHQVPAARARWRYFRSRCYLEGRSKAIVSHLVGIKDGLASERTYTFQTLPRGVVHSIADAVLRCDLTGLGRAGSIIAGLTITIMGYLVGTVGTIAARLSKRKQVPYEVALACESISNEVEPIPFLY